MKRVSGGQGIKYRDEEESSFGVERWGGSKMTMGAYSRGGGSYWPLLKLTHGKAHKLGFLLGWSSQAKIQDVKK